METRRVLTRMSKKIWFSKIIDPDRFEDFPKGVWVGHPRIARFIARVWNKYSCWRYGHWFLPDPEWTHCGRCMKKKES